MSSPVLHPTAVLVVMSAAAWVVTLVFAFAVPRRADVQGQRGIRRIGLRWGHSAAWAALALSFLLRALDGPGALADALALAGGLVYATYLILLLATPRLTCDPTPRQRRR